MKLIWGDSLKDLTSSDEWIGKNLRALPILLFKGIRDFMYLKGLGSILALLSFVEELLMQVIQPPLFHIWKDTPTHYYNIKFYEIFAELQLMKRR